MDIAARGAFCIRVQQAHFSCIEQNTVSPATEDQIPGFLLAVENMGQSYGGHQIEVVSSAPALLPGEAVTVRCDYIASPAPPPLSGTATSETRQGHIMSSAPAGLRELPATETEPTPDVIPDLTSITVVYGGTLSPGSGGLCDSSSIATR